MRRESEYVELDYVPGCPSNELKKLRPFAGRWRVEGHNSDHAPVSPGRFVQGEESYEWLKGNFFMICKWRRHVELNIHVGIGIISFNEAEHKFYSRNFDNMGYARTYELINSEEGVWDLEGEFERGTFQFGKDGRSMMETWEMQSGDGVWLPLCELKGNKI